MAHLGYYSGSGKKISKSESAKKYGSSSSKVGSKTRGTKAYDEAQAEKNSREAAVARIQAAATKQALIQRRIQQTKTAIAKKQQTKNRITAGERKKLLESAKKGAAREAERITIANAARRDSTVTIQDSEGRAVLRGSEGFARKVEESVREQDEALLTSSRSVSGVSESRAYSLDQSQSIDPSLVKDTSPRAYSLDQSQSIDPFLVKDTSLQVTQRDSGGRAIAVKDSQRQMSIGSKGGDYFAEDSLLKARSERQLSKKQAALKEGMFDNRMDVAPELSAWQKLNRKLGQAQARAEREGASKEGAGWGVLAAGVGAGLADIAIGAGKVIVEPIGQYFKAKGYYDIPKDIITITESFKQKGFKETIASKRVSPITKIAGIPGMGLGISTAISMARKRVSPRVSPIAEIAGMGSALSAAIKERPLKVLGGALGLSFMPEIPIAKTKKPFVPKGIKQTNERFFFCYAEPVAKKAFEIKFKENKLDFSKKQLQQQAESLEKTNIAIKDFEMGESFKNIFGKVDNIKITKTKPITHGPSMVFKSSKYSRKISGTDNIAPRLNKKYGISLKPYKKMQFYKSTPKRDIVFELKEPKPFTTSSTPKGLFDPSRTTAKTFAETFAEIKITKKVKKVYKGPEPVYSSSIYSRKMAGTEKITLESTAPFKRIKAPKTIIDLRTKTTKTAFNKDFGITVEKTSTRRKELAKWGTKEESSKAFKDVFGEVKTKDSKLIKDFGISIEKVPQEAKVSELGLTVSKTSSKSKKRIFKMSDVLKKDTGTGTGTGTSTGSQGQVLLQKLEPPKVLTKQKVKAKSPALLKKVRPKQKTGDLMFLNPLPKKKKISFSEETVYNKPTTRLTATINKPILAQAKSLKLRTIPIMNMRISQKQSQSLSLTNAQSPALTTKQSPILAQAQGLAMDTSLAQSPTLINLYKQSQGSLMGQATKQSPSTTLITDKIFKTTKTTIAKTTTTSLDRIIPKESVRKKKLIKFRKRKKRLVSKEQTVPGYNVFVRSKGKKVQMNKNLMSKTNALSKMAETLDNTASRTGRITKTKTMIKKPLREDSYFKETRKKLVLKDKVKNIYQEKTTYAIDSLGEYLGITAKGIRARKSGITKKSRGKKQWF